MSGLLEQARLGLLSLDLGELCEHSLIILENTYPLITSTSIFVESNAASYQASSAALSVRDRLKALLSCVVFTAKTIPRHQPTGALTTQLSLAKLLQALELPYATFIVAIRDFLSSSEPALVRLYRQEGYAHIQAAAKDVIERFTVSYGVRHHLSKKLEPCLGSSLALSHPLVAATWLMFVVTKGRNPAIELEGMPALAELLACAVNKLVTHAPSGILRADPILPTTTAAKELYKARGPRGEIDTLTSICDAFKVPRSSADRVRRLMDLLDAAVAEAVGRHPELAGCVEEGHPAADMISFGCRYHRGLMEGGHLGSLIEALRADYDSIMASSRGEVDERIFETDAFVAQTATGTAPTAPQSNPLVGDLRTLTPVAHRVAAPAHLPMPLGGAGAGPTGHPTPTYSTFARTGSLPAPSPLRPGPFGTAVQSPLMNRISGLPPTTPVTASLNATLWLRQLANDLPDSQLEAPPCFRNLDPATAATIRETIGRHVTTALPEPQRNGSGFQSVQPESVHHQRRVEATRLCYLVLDRMTGGDAGALTQLAVSDRSLRSFVALVCEAVLWCHQPVGFLFPATLERLDLTPFDIFRFIRPFHQYGQVPAELDRYLIKIMMNLVEERAWERGSQLFIFLCKACEHMAPSGVTPVPASQAPVAAHPAGPSAPHRLSQRENTEVSEALGTQRDSGENSQVTGGSQPAGHFLLPQGASGPQPNSDAHHARITWLPDAFEEDRDSPDAPSTSQENRGQSEQSQRREAHPPLETPSRLVVREFFHQVIKLARERIGTLCDRMDLESRELRQLLKALALEVVEKALYKRTKLFYNRHVDQIMLCAVYGVCKVLQMKEQKFKDIVQRYQRQPQSSQTVFRQVITKQTLPGLEVEQRNDIIVFYNQVFMPEMKKFLLECNRSPRMIAFQQSQPTTAPPMEPASTSLGGPSAHVSANPSQPHGSPLVRPVGIPAQTPPMRTAAPNILVSPLKVGVAGLVSANQNNYVVVLGEPLHAFTSPSKEIQTINERLREVNAPAAAGAGTDEREAKRRRK